MFGKVFRISVEKMSSYLRNCFCKSVRTAFYVNKRKAFLSSLTRNLCFLKCLFFFKFLSDSKQHISSFSPLNFLAGLSKLHLGVQRNISWRKPIWNNLFFLNLIFSDFEQKVLGLFTKIFWQISKKPIYVSRGTVYEKVWDKKKS